MCDKVGLFDNNDDQMSNKVKLCLLKNEEVRWKKGQEDEKWCYHSANDRGNFENEGAFNDVEDEDISCVDDHKCLKFWSDSEMEKFVLAPSLNFKNGNEYKMVIRNYSVRREFSLSIRRMTRTVIVKCRNCDN